jgi:hypothetical protein
MHSHGRKRTMKANAIPIALIISASIPLVHAQNVGDSEEHPTLNSDGFKPTPI